MVDEQGRGDSTQVIGPTDDPEPQVQDPDGLEGVDRDEDQTDQASKEAQGGK